MKKYYFLLLFLCFLFCGCSKKNVLEGKWETIALLKDGQEQELYESNVNFELSGVLYKVKGLAGFNLFTVFVQDNGNSIEPYGMQNTGFMGTEKEMEYEDMFFDAFLNSDSYKIKKNILHFYNSKKNLELRLQNQE